MVSLCENNVAPTIVCYVNIVWKWCWLNRNLSWQQLWKNYKLLCCVLSKSVLF